MVTAKQKPFFPNLRSLHFKNGGVEGRAMRLEGEKC